MQLAEWNYEIYNKKLLAIVEAITKWRQYLLDAIEKFKVWTDHENLKYFWEPHKLNGRQVRWYLKLQDYDFILQHISRKTNTKANVLSRKDYINTTEDNKDIQMLKDKMWMRRLITPEIKIIQRNYYIKRDTMEWNERTRSTQGIGKERWTNMGREWNCLCGWKNLYTK